MRRLLTRILIIAFALGVFSPFAFAAKRVALVIGNANYQHTRVLPNPKNDAEAVGQVLRDIGFEITIKTDLTYTDLRSALRDFGNAANGADIAVIHYAGHGLERAGENYILPVDAQVRKDTDLEYEAVTLSSVLNAVGGATQLRLVILDACRNNPLGEKMALSSGTTRSVSRGLAHIEPTGDVLVAYSAKAGTVAKDGDGTLSPYATALVKHLRTPEQDVRLLFGKVRDEVLAVTQHEQEPYTYGSLGGALVPLVANERGNDIPTGDALGRYGSWEVTCKPTESGKKACALLQTAFVDDKKSAGLTVFFQRFSNGTQILRVFAPTGILTDPGVRLKIDGRDLGHAPFKRCQQSSCYAQVAIDDKLVSALKRGKTAVFVIFSQEEHGMGIPVSLEGFSAAIERLEQIGD